MKKVAIMTIAIVLVLSLAACNAPAAQVEEAASVSTGAPGSIGAWTLKVMTDDGEKAFTSDDAAKLTSITIEATTTNKKGESTTATYVGVKLSDILSVVGVAEFSTLTIEAGDGFTAEYTKDLALKDDTLLAWSKDGELLSGDHPIQMVPATGTGNQFVKETAIITVNK